MFRYVDFCRFISQFQIRFLIITALMEETQRDRNEYRVVKFVIFKILCLCQYLKWKYERETKKIHEFY